MRDRGMPAYLGHPPISCVPVLVATEKQMVEPRALIIDRLCGCFQWNTPIHHDAPSCEIDFVLLYAVEE